MQPGQRIGQYVLLEKLGEGGMGEVWKAQHTRMLRMVAIKFLRESATFRPQVAERFLNEAQLQSRLHHPNIVSVFDAFEEGGLSCMVMGFVDGESLEQSLKRNAPRSAPIPQVLSISADVLAALEYAHTFPEGPVVHRDVKPSNILIDKSGKAQLTDFGIAFALNGNRLTQEGTALGTVFYMSPEQITDPRKVDARSDIYSFGCVLYELLTGRPPFGAETDTDFTIKTQHVKDTPAPLRRWNAAVPFDFEWIVLRALNKDPEKRFASCAEMARVMAAAFAQPVTGTIPAIQASGSPVTGTRPAAIPGPGTPVPGTPGQGTPVPRNPEVRNPGQSKGTQIELTPQLPPQSLTNPWGMVPPAATVVTPVPATSGTRPVASIPPLLRVPPQARPQPPAQPGPANSKKKLWIGAAVLLLLIGAGVFFLRDSLFGASEQIVLAMHGSTSVGDELAPKMAEAFLREQLKATKTGSYVASKDSAGHSHVHVWGEVPGKSERQVIEIYATGSGDAFKCLATDSGPDHCDIGMSSRPFGPGDRKNYPSLGNLSSGSLEHVIALDGIAVIVNPGNAVDHLSIQQLRAIYTGQIGNWNQVGGADAPIELYGRDQKSGTGEMFAQMVVGKDAQGHPRSVVVPSDHQIEDSGAIVDAVMQSPNAIGYVSSPLARDAKALAISDGSSAALRPTELAIVTEDYPIGRRLYLYQLSSASAMAQSFIRYAMKPEGQDVVSQAHYVSLTPKVFPVEASEIPANAPPQYREIAERYSRLGLSFRFASGQSTVGNNASSRLDNLAHDNVARLESFLSQHNAAGHDIVLIGYADNQPGSISNDVLAKSRALSVSNSLQTDDVVVPPDHIGSFGSELPVASNDQPEGRGRNRRVEVWVRKGLS
jgi:phosphate transport system substrate-binding protein